MSDYDHSHALKEVTVRDDRTHVEAMLRKLDAYAQSGGKEALGDFLTALVVGDLAEATAHADGVNIKYLRTYMRYLHCRVPRTHVNLGRPVLRVIRGLMKDEGQPIRQSMVEKAMVGFASRLRALMHKEDSGD